MTLNITEGTIPAVTSNRSREANPFEGKFPTAEGKTMVVDLPSVTAEEKAFVQKVKAQAHAAARDTVTDDAPKGYTARVKLSPCEVPATDENGEPIMKRGKPVMVEGTRLEIWSTDRVFREGAGRRKNNGAPDVGSSAEAPAEAAQAS